MKMMETLLDVLRSLFLGRACSRDLLRNDSVDPGMPGGAMATADAARFVFRFGHQAMVY